MIINVMIEIPKHSVIKYEYCRQKKQIQVDRILYGSQAYPQNYGFIPKTLDYDGDELDALVIANQAFYSGVLVPTRIIGALEMIDDGEYDTKIIGVVAVDPRFAQIQTLGDLSPHLWQEIEHFFQTYKQLENKKVKILGFKNQEWAIVQYQTCQELMAKYHHLTKSEFIAKMKELFPQKYVR